MTFARLTLFALLVLLNPAAPQKSPQPDWSKIEEEDHAPLPGDSAPGHQQSTRQ